MFEYYFFKFLLILGLITSSYFLNKKQNNGSFFYNFWIAIIPALLSYSIVEGFRYGRGYDYFSYFDYFSGFQSIEFEPIFQYYVQFIVFLRNPFLGFFFSSCFLIFSGIILLKRFRFLGLFYIPLFFLGIIDHADNLLRMYFSFSFILIGYFFLLRKSYYFFLLFFIFAFLSHYSSIILFPFIVFLLLFENPFKNRYIVLILFLISNIFPISPDFFSTYLPIFSGFGLYENYIESSGRWLFGDEKYLVVSDFGLLFSLRFYLVPFLILFLGFDLIEKFSVYKFNVFYYLFLFGVAFMPTAIALPTEFFYRIALYFKTFEFIVLSFLFYYYFSSWKTLNLITKISIIYILFDKIYLFLTIPFRINHELQYKFIWDLI